jgi:hypothetical protein
MYNIELSLQFVKLFFKKLTIKKITQGADACPLGMP